MAQINRIYFFLIFFCAFFPATCIALETLSISFYSEKIQLDYDPDFIIQQKAAVDEYHIVNYYKALKQTHYQPLLSQLKKHKADYQLNDWLYFELLQKSVSELFRSHGALQRNLVNWFLLAESGFDVRLTYLQQEIYLYIYTEEELYEVPLIEDGGRTFASLSGLLGEQAEGQALYLLNFVPNPKGKSFSFYLTQLPKLHPEIEEKIFQINFEDTTYQLKINSDRTIIKLMQNYPLIKEEEYLKTPFSQAVAQSLLPQLQDIIRGRKEEEALKLLIAFTRSSFQYKEDKLHFGYSKPMIAEEVFYYPFSDCEDRSALFFGLVKELLDLPMVIIAFEDHLTIGVALKNIEGEGIRYQGRKYYICDPTGPVNSTRIGQFPKGYEIKPFEIIGTHK